MNKKASLKTWIFKTLMNLYPMYFGTGGKVLFISSDWQEVRLRLKLNMWTRNYVGTIFGGSYFSAADPMYMLMFVNALGSKYIVWDKAATIHFRKPGKTTVFAAFLISSDLLEEIRQELAVKGETVRSFPVQWRDKEGVVYAEMERVVYFATKDFYKKKLAAKKV